MSDMGDNTTTNTGDGTAPAPGAGQREALEDAQRKATERQPENFKDRSTDEKVVEIGPDVTDAPIKGIDPDPRSGN